MHRGYVKLFRKVRDNPRLKDPHYLALWVWLLVEATHSDRDEMLGGKRITCKPGQFTKGRKQLAELSGINESKVERLLSLMESEQQIEQRKTTANRLITITNWNEYQESEQRCEQQVNNDRTTSEQQVNTLKALKNVKAPKKEKPTANPISFLEALKSNPAYKSIDIDRELSKMDAWLLLPKNKNRQKTPRFILNWLNKIERPLVVELPKRKEEPTGVRTVDGETYSRIMELKNG